MPRNKWEGKALPEEERGDKSEVGLDFSEIQNSRESEPSREVQLSAYERAFVFEDKAYVVWTEGPQEGKVYREIPSSGHERLSRVPTLEQVKEELKGRFSKLEQMIKEWEGLKEAQDPSRYDLIERIQEELAESYIYFHEIYYGSEGVAGLEEAQLYDLQGEGGRYAQLIAEVNPHEPKMGQDAGYRKYLKDIALEFDFAKVAERLGSASNPPQEEAAFNKLYYDGLEKLYDNFPADRTKSPVLLHMTYSNVLTNIIQMKGLASKKYYESHGIKKRFGGESQGANSYTSGHVSFWERPQTISGGYGSKRGFEYPVAFGIDASHVEGLQLNSGTMDSERTVEDFVPLESISQVYVPSFKVDEVRKLFSSHGFDVEVLPLRQELADSP